MKETEIRPKELFTKYLELSRKDSESFDKTKFEVVNCVACNSSHTTKKFEKNGFVYDMCLDCGTVFCNPRPSLQTLDEFYKYSKSAKFWFEDFLPKVEEVRREKIFKKKAKELSNLIQEKDIKIKTLCDVGAGSGIFIEELRKIRGDIDCFAIEPGKVSSNILKNKGVNVLQESVENSDVWNEKFDFVVSLEVLEHVNKPVEFVKSIFNLLKTGGSCLITSLGCEGFDILTLGEKSNSISPPHHLNFPTIEGYEELFKRAGFKKVEVTTPGVLDVDIVLNSGFAPEYLKVLQSRGEEAIREFQDYLVKYQMSSHVWVLAGK